MKTLTMMGVSEQTREVNQLLTSYPETKMANLLQKRVGLAKRRAKNKRASSSRRKNRGK